MIRRYTNQQNSLANQDATKWPALTIISIENNFDCSKTITADQQAAPAGTGYLIQFVNTLNSTDVWFHVIYSL